MAIWEHIRDAKQAETDGLWSVAGMAWRRAGAATLVINNGSRSAAEMYVGKAIHAESKIKFENHLTNPTRDGSVGTVEKREAIAPMKDKMEQALAAKASETVVGATATLPSTTTVAAPPSVIVARAASLSIAERLFSSSPPVTEDEGPILRCEIQETTDEYHLVIPKKLTVDQLTQRMGRGNVPTGLVYAPVEAKGVRIGFEAPGPNGTPRVVHLQSKGIEFQLSFRVDG